MFAATSKAYLDEVLRARAHPIDSDSLLNFRTELQNLPLDAPFWAMRRFTSTALMKEFLGDKEIVGYSVYMEKDEKRVVVRSISGNPDGFEICSKLWGSYLKREGPIKPLEMVEENPATMRITLDATIPKGNVPLFLLFAVLGHPIFV